MNLHGKKTMSDKESEILGVRIDNLSIDEIKEKILYIFDNSPQQKFITTLNPEILVRAHQDEKYRNILNSADLNVCDGFGLKLISFLRNYPIRDRFAGVDLADFLLETADPRKLRILVVTAKNSLSLPSEIEQAIGARYPYLSVKSEYFPPGQNIFPNAIIKEAEIVFVNFGAPEQEKFIFENRAKFPKAKILIGVGGTFDFLTGKISRAPYFLRALGLEWLWRLIMEPKRIRRICHATIIFPFLALTRK
jgi:N-acetylglucosaminyldiphosphoundecaprenol N-acetyl-beta-D-mannosaminyltransferase